jgi:hypothetical protein
MFLKATLGAGESSRYFLVNGNCDILISGLTAGSVKLEALFQGEVAPIDLPGGSFNADIFETIFISEDQVRLRFTGVGNNAGVVVRFGRYKS